MPTSGNTVDNTGLQMKYVVEQGKKFLPITHRKAIMGLSANTLTLSKSIDVEVDEIDHSITLNPLITEEFKKMNDKLVEFDQLHQTTINKEITDLWTKVTKLNYAASSEPGGSATTAVMLAKPFTFTLTGDCEGTVSIDGGNAVSCNVKVMKTQNNYAAANVDGGPANTALKLNSKRTISIIGDMVGQADFDGSKNIFIDVEENHTHEEYSLTTHLHDDRYSKLGHDHLYAASATAGGIANSTLKLNTARNIAIAGAVTGHANFDGTSNITINVSVNHTHDQYSLTSHNHNGVYAYASHSHNYLPLSGGTVTGNLGANGRYYQNGTVGCLTAVQSGSPNTSMVWAW